MWPSSLTKPDLHRFRCCSRHVVSKTNLVTPGSIFSSWRAIGMVGGITMSGVNNGKFVIDFRSSQSSAGAFMHSLNGRLRG